MRLKSFYGSTMTEAMGLVRQALGEAAIIVATRDEPDGGVRVTAALDEASMPGEVPQEVIPASEGGDSIDIIASALVEHKVPAALAEKILAAATPFAGEDVFFALGAALDAHFLYAPMPFTPAKPLILIGPPGAGKTLCVAKMATKAVLEKKKTVLIGADTERAGAMAQLEAFARILKVELLQVEDAHALRDAVGIQSEDTLVLIDAAGCNPFDAGQKQFAASLMRDVSAEPCLVLPADWDSETAASAARIFAEMGAARLIVTRLDMSGRMGGFLRAAHEARLPMSLFSVSSQVTQALLPLNPVSLARLILPHHAEGRARQTKGAA